MVAAASRDPVNPAAPQEMERGAYEERRPADPLAPHDHVLGGGSDGYPSGQMGPSAPGNI